nr:MAG TPA: hypothetical protein [Caudoviricetes sp.]
MSGWRPCWCALAGRPDLKHTMTLPGVPSEGLKGPGGYPR